MYEFHHYYIPCIYVRARVTTDDTLKKNENNNNNNL